jgi:hypothetical protein
MNAASVKKKIADNRAIIIASASTAAVAITSAVLVHKYLTREVMLTVTAENAERMMTTGNKMIFDTPLGDMFVGMIPK